MSLETGAPQGRPAHGHQKVWPKKSASLRWRLAPCSYTGLLNPTADFAAMGRDYSPELGRRKRAGFSRMFRKMESETSYETPDFLSVSSPPMFNCPTKDECSGMKPTRSNWHSPTSEQISTQTHQHRQEPADRIPTWKGAAQGLVASLGAFHMHEGPTF